jgi:hypothetical protein
VVEIHLKLPESIHNQIQLEAEKQHKPVNDLVIECLMQHLSLLKPQQKPASQTSPNADYERFATAWALPDQRTTRKAVEPFPPIWASSDRRKREPK